jgi:hypothetical protein
LSPEVPDVFDLIFLAVLAGFALSTWGLVRLCGWLEGGTR